MNSATSRKFKKVIAGKTAIFSTEETSMKPTEMSGILAAEYLGLETSTCVLHRKDNTDKLWSYKFRRGSRTEFAFDPNTSTCLRVRIDREPPSGIGLHRVENIQGKSVSTALDRVFSGGMHKARWKCEIPDRESFEKFLDHFSQI